MSKIHSFSVFVCIAFGAALVQAHAATAPPQPTITAIVSDGSYGIVYGVAQGNDDYTIGKVFICVLDKVPTDTKQALANCAAGTPAPAALLNPPAGSTFAVPSATDGTFTAILSTKLTPGQYVYLTVQSTPKPSKAPAVVAPAAPDVLSAGMTIPGSYTRTAPLGAAMAGLDVSGASSTDYKAVFLGTGIMDLPLYTGNDISKAPWWLNGMVRVAGMAQPGTLNGALGSTASAATYLASAINADPDNIVQSIEASGTVALQFAHWTPSADTFDVGSYQTANLSSPATLLTLSGILSFGAITPLSASQANPPVYNLTNQILLANPGVTFPTSCVASAGVISSTACYVSFVPSDRSHFYRNYEAGLRLKLYAGDYKDNKYRFPGMADLTFGQNEYVTGGHLRNFVLHIGGVMPVPRLDGVYIFGSMDTELNKNTGGGPQLILTPASPPASGTPLTFTSPLVTDISVSQPNRDRYRLGFGIDIFHLISSYVKPASATATTTSK